MLKADAPPGPGTSAGGADGAEGTRTGSDATDRGSKPRDLDPGSNGGALPSGPASMIEVEASLRLKLCLVPRHSDMLVSSIIFLKNRLLHLPDQTGQDRDA